MSERHQPVLPLQETQAACAPASSTETQGDFHSPCPAAVGALPSGLPEEQAACPCRGGSGDRDSRVVCPAHHPSLGIAQHQETPTHRNQLPCPWELRSARGCPSPALGTPRGRNRTRCCDKPASHGSEQGNLPRRSLSCSHHCLGHKPATPSPSCPNLTQSIKHFALNDSKASKNPQLCPSRRQQQPNRDLKGKRRKT